MADNPNCQSDELWCDPTNYPDFIMKSILSSDLKVTQFLDKNKPILEPRISNFDFDFENVCNEHTEYIFPRAAKNKDHKWMFIVNRLEGDTEAHYRQMVKLTKCASPGFECGEGEVFAAETKCVQEYSDHKLVALNETENDLIVDTFSFPSCCLCKINNFQIRK